MSGATLRRAVRRVHLWLGMTVGGLFALIGLTGSALVFYTAIDAGLHPVVESGGGAAPDACSPVWDRVIATALAHGHDPAGKWSFELTGAGGAIPARYYAMAGHHADRMMVWFAPDGARIVRAQPWGGYLMSWVYEVHMALLMGDTGGQIVGWSGVAMLVLLATGLWAWWPRGSWRKALAFKRRAVPIRRWRDLHKWSGLGSAAILIVLTGTGVLLALPEVAGALLAPAPVTVPPPGRSGPRAPIRLMLAAAHRALPDGRLVFFDVPVSTAVPVRARFQVPGDPHRRFPGSYVFVDQVDARVLSVRDVRRAGAGAMVNAWVRPLHDGTIAGLPTRVLALLIGLAPSVLFATGVLHWRRRAARPA